MKKILVFGWYNQGNLGDELFKEAFRGIWPHHSFNFTETIPKNFSGVDALWLGGGSFLDQTLSGSANIPKDLPIFVLGVGIGNLQNKELLSRAKLVVVRDPVSQSLWPNSILAPDLVFSLPISPSQTKSEKRIAICLNDFITPKQEAPEWKTTSYARFLVEFSKVCDIWVEQGFALDFFPFCINPNNDDRRVAAAVIGKMRLSQKANWILESVLSTARSVFNRSSFVVSTRFHSIVLANLLEKPQIVLSHHSKLEAIARENTLPWYDYYGFTDRVCLDLQAKIRPFERGNYLREAYQTWKNISATVDALL